MGVSRNLSLALVGSLPPPNKTNPQNFLEASLWYERVRERELEKKKMAEVEREQLLLGSKELGTNVLELHIVILANHDQNVLILFRLAQVCGCM